MNQKSTFTYGHLENQTKVLIEPKLENIETKLGHDGSMFRNPNELFKVATSTRPTSMTSLNPRIKCLRPRLNNFVENDGTFV